MNVIRDLFSRLVIGAQFVIGAVLLLVFLVVWALRRGGDDDDDHD
jgi:ABC-type antimicrobial peptide transport system permease subunit